MSNINIVNPSKITTSTKHFHSPYVDLYIPILNNPHGSNKQLFVSTLFASDVGTYNKCYKTTTYDDLIRIPLQRVATSDATGNYLSNFIDKNAGFYIDQGESLILYVKKGTYGYITFVELFSNENTTTTTTPIISTWSDSVNTHEVVVDNRNTIVFDKKIVYGQGIFISYLNNILHSPKSNASQEEIFEEISYSYDGISWKGIYLNIPKPPSDTRTFISNMTHGGGKFVAITHYWNGVGMYALVSTDGGISWKRYVINKETNSLSPNYIPNMSTMCMTYGNGRFVMIGKVGNNNYSIYSDDGINWSRGSFPTFVFDFHDMTYGNGKFVAVYKHNNFNQQGVIYSTDGITWSSSNLVSLPMTPNYTKDVDNNKRKLTYGNGIFVCIGDKDKVFYSSDAITWNTSSLPVYKTIDTKVNDITWNSISYGDGYFFAIKGYSSFAAYSTDGITWNTSKLPTNPYWSSLEYGNGKFVAVSKDSGNVAYIQTGVSAPVPTPTPTHTPTPTITQTPLAYSTLPTTLDANNVVRIGNYSSITYGGGKFVSIMKGDVNINQIKTAAYSHDGITWNSSTLPFHGNWNSVTYGNGTFVASANFSFSGGNYGGINRLIYSTDGINWNQSSSNNTTDANWTSITYGNGTFVAVSNSNSPWGGAIYSTDGINWTRSSTTGGLVSVAYGNGKFVAISQYNGVLISTNAINWTATIPSGWNRPNNTTYYKNIVYGGGKFVVNFYANDAFNNTIKVSDDGINWTTATISNILNQGIKSIIYDGQKFIASNNKKIYYSFNAISWTYYPDVLLPFDVSDVIGANGMVYADGKYVCISSNFTCYFELPNLIDVSTPTATPTATPTPTPTPTATNTATTVTPTSTPTATPTVTPTATPTATSTATPTYEMWSSSNLIESSAWTSVAFGNNKFVAVSYDSNKVLNSTDGVTWSSSTLPVGSVWASVAFGNNKFVAISYDSNQAAYSTDGISWTVSALPASLSNVMTSITYGGGKFVAISTFTDEAVYSTDDGVTWTAFTMPDGIGYNSIAYSGTRFVAIGGINSTAYSTDGVSWSIGALPNNDSLYSKIAYGNGKFVAFPDAITNKFAYSTNGISWTIDILPYALEWTSIVYGGTRFIAVGVDDASIYSTNGITWNTALLPSNSAWSSVAYGNGKFVAVAIASNNGAYLLE